MTDASSFSASTQDAQPVEPPEGDEPGRTEAGSSAPSAAADATASRETAPRETAPRETEPPETDPPETDPREAIIEHLPALRAFALSLCRDGTLADDLVQDTLVKAWSKFHLFTPGTNLRAWMFTILRNCLHSMRRKRRREVADPDGAMVAGLATKPDHDGRLALADLAAAFAQLPMEQREALLLVGAMGFSVEEAAETCGCAPGTIKSRAARGRQALADLLGLERGEGMDLTEAATLAVIGAQGISSGQA